MDEISKLLAEGIRAAVKELQLGQKVHVDTGATNLQPATWITGAGMFSPCGSGELLSTVVEDNFLSQWLGSMPTVVDPAINKILGWYGPIGTGAGSPDWGRTTTCEAPPTVEYGKCETLACLGEVGFAGGDLSLLSLGLKGCENAPKLYVTGPHAGAPITDERVWQLALAAGAAAQAYERMNIVGNRQTNALQWDGLQRLINTPVIDYRTGGRCQDAEPLIQDWASAAMSANICDLISAMVRRLRHRARQLGSVGRGDMILLMTSLMRDALIDFAGCGCGPCAGAQYNEVNVNPLDARQERARLATGGTYGMGMFEVDGIPVDILTSDWIPQTSIAPRFCSDIFILTRKVSAERVLYVEYQDFAQTLAGVDPSKLAQGAQVTDGGRFLILSQNVHECFNQEMFMKARLRLRAPWLQGRLTNICAPFDIPPMVPIPGDAYSPQGATPGNAAAYASTPYTYGPCEGF